MNRISLSLLIFVVLIGIIFPFPIIGKVTVLISSVYLFSYILSRYLYKSITVLREQNDYYLQHLEEGKSCLRIYNNSILQNNNLEIQDLGHGIYQNGEGIFSITMDPNSEAQFSSKINSGARGVYKAGPVVIKGSDPLNFFPWKKEVLINCKIVIYPKIDDLDLLLISGERGGRNRVKNKLYEDLTDLKSIRDFRNGDSVKRVNWKASAKQGKIQIMEFNNTLSTPVLIILDIRKQLFPVKNRYNYIERSLEAVASITYNYGIIGESVALFTNSEEGIKSISGGRGYEHIVSIYSTLAEIEAPDKGESITTLFRESYIKPPAGSHIYIITPDIESVVTDLKVFNKDNYTINLINSSGVGKEYSNRAISYYYLNLYGDSIYD